MFSRRSIAAALGIDRAWRPSRMLACAFVTAACVNPLHAQVSAPEYGVKLESAATGSSVRRYNLALSPVPVNRSFGELSAEERQTVRLWFASLNPSDEPPYPKEGLRPIYAAISKAQQLILTWGKLKARAWIDVTGNVDRIEFLELPDPRLREVMIATLFPMKFKPALCGGTPCEMEFPIDVTFKAP